MEDIPGGGDAVEPGQKGHLDLGGPRRRARERPKVGAKCSILRACGRNAADERGTCLRGRIRARGSGGSSRAASLSRLARGRRAAAGLRGTCTKGLGQTWGRRGRSSSAMLRLRGGSSARVSAVRYALRAVRSLAGGLGCQGRGVMRQLRLRLRVRRHSRHRCCWCRGGRRRLAGARRRGRHRAPRRKGSDAKT